MYQHTLPFGVGIVLCILSVGSILSGLFYSVKRTRRIFEAKKKYKAKWAGVLSVVSGLSPGPGKDGTLLLTRRDELVFDDPQRMIVLPLEDIHVMAICNGDTLLRVNDAKLGQHAGLSMTPNFSYVRSYIQRHPQSKRKLFLIIQPNDTSMMLEQSDLIILCDTVGMANLRAFLQRPEIASLTRVLPGKHFRKERLAKGDKTHAQGLKEGPEPIKLRPGRIPVGDRLHSEDKQPDDNTGGFYVLRDRDLEAFNRSEANDDL